MSKSAYMTACEQSISKALGDTISIEEFQDEMQGISDAIELARASSEDVQSAVSHASNDLIRSAERSAMIRKRNAYKNKLTEQEVFRQIDASYAAFGKKKNSLYHSVKAVLVGMNTPFTGAQRSVDGISQALKNEYFGALSARLRKEDVMETFRSGMKRGSEMEHQIAVAVKHLNTKDAVGEAPRVGAMGSRGYQDAMKIARALVDTQEALRLRLNRAGADVPKLSGFMGHQMHSQLKIQRKGFDAWKAVAQRELDWDKMKIPEARREDFLQSVYNAQYTGVRKEFGKDPDPLAEGFKGKNNLARSLSHSRLLHFKTAKGWLEYNREFGAGDFRQNLIQDLAMTTKNIAIMERMTTNPENFLDGMIDAIGRKYRDENPEAVRVLETRRNRLHNDMDVVTGAVNFGSHETIAQVGEWLRALKTMAALGGSFVSALTDVVFNANNRIYHGKNFFEAWGDAFLSPLQRLGSEDRVIVSELLGAGLEMKMGSMLSRFSSDDYMHGETAGMMNTFFKWNLLGPWTDSVKAGATMILSRDLAMNAAKPFDGLSGAHKRLLDLYGIDAKQWSVIRQAAKEADDGRTYILPGDIDEVTGSAFTGMSKFQQRELKTRARENLFLLYSSEADFAAPTPGAREQSMMKSGLTPDSFAGQAIRMFTQFKSFPLTATTKVMGRATYGGGSNMQMVNLLVGSLVAGAAVVQLKEMAKGREPRDMATKEFAIKAFLQGGAAGLYGDFLLAKHNEYGGGLLGSIAGPVPADIETILHTAHDALIQGDTSQFGRNAVQLLKGNVPGSNLFYTKMATDYLLWYQLQELVNPGYVKRMERNLKNRTGQEYVDLPIVGTPAETIKRGSGFE